MVNALAVETQALRIQCRDYTKHNTVPNATVVRGHETYTHATENPELGIFWTGEQTNGKICPEIFITVFIIFVC